MLPSASVSVARTYLVLLSEGRGSEKEKLSISMGQVFNPEKNQDLPSKSSLDQHMSDVVGEINYNFSEIGFKDIFSTTIPFGLPI